MPSKKESYSAPAMSVILTTPDNYQTIKKTLSHLNEQSVRDALEIVIVAPSREILSLDERSVSGFHGYKIVEYGTIASIGRANAAGIRAATADVVVLAEDHCFPESDWAERLIAAHRGSWAAVGPAVKNANPRSVVSWADLFIGYGPWLLPTASREVDFLPGHNSSYKRETLLAYGEALEPMMESETVLHWDLRGKGEKLFLDASAVVAHTNFSLWSSWLSVQFYNGRVFAGARVRDMSFPKKMVFTFGSPLIPFVRLARIAAPIRSASLVFRFLQSLPTIFLGLTLDGIGQMIGYAFGSGNSVRKTAKYEFHRIEHITIKDRKEVFG